MENTEGVTLLLVLLLGSVAMLLLGVGVIFFVSMHQRRVIAHQAELRAQDEKMQQELLRATIMSQEEEQRRISRDLHDDIGPMLSAVKLKLGQINRQLANNDITTTYADEAKAMLDTSINQVRNISHQLLPPVLDDYGLAEALADVCHKVNTPELKVEYTQQGTYTRRDKETELTLYRITLELINNIVKHSRANKVEVKLKTTPNQLQLSVADNGIGFDPAEPKMSAGLGLKNIRSRLKSIGTDISYTRLQPGMLATVNLPL